MTVIALAAPLTMKDCVVKFGATDEYQKAVTSVKLTPSSSVITQAAVSPGAVYSDSTPAIWQLDMSFLQDWADPDSLGRYLFANQGDTVALTFEPKSGGGTSIGVDVIVAPGAIGGDVGAYAIADVSLGCIGEPVFTDS